MKKEGAVNFVVHKIRSKNHPITIAETLFNMGYDHDEISESFIEAGKSIQLLHQELISSNDFLPTLNENLEDYFKLGNINIFKKVIIGPQKIKSIPRTLFPYPAPKPFVVDLIRRGKDTSITRHVFAFRLMYAMSVSILGIVIAYIFLKTKGLSFDLKVNLPSLVLGGIFIFYVLQLIAHRIKNAGMNPWLAFLVLTPLLGLMSGLTKNDQILVFILSCIPATSVFIVALLTPPHINKL